MRIGQNLAMAVFIASIAAILFGRAFLSNGYGAIINNGSDQHACI